MSSDTISTKTKNRLRAATLFIAPAVVMLGHGSHPWIGNPGDADFVYRLAEAVAADPTHWAVSHFLIGVGSGLLALAFLALRGFLRASGEDRWSAVGLPMVVFGSVVYAMLPAMELAPVAAVLAGEDAAAVQRALMRWFAPTLLASALIFGVGIGGFCVAIVRSSTLGYGLSWLVVGALLVMAAARFFPLGVAQLYVGPLAGIVALWPLGYRVLTSSDEHGGAGRDGAAGRFGDEHEDDLPLPRLEPTIPQGQGGRR